MEVTISIGRGVVGVETTTFKSLLCFPRHTWSFSHGGRMYVVILIAFKVGATRDGIPSIVSVRGVFKMVSLFWGLFPLCSIV